MITTKPFLRVSKLPLFAAAVAAVLVAQGETRGATVTQADPVPGQGISYYWTVVMGASDVATMINKVGAWSWDEDANASTTLGWTHTSNWIALTLTEPVVLTMRVEPQEGVPNPQYPGDDTTAGTNIFPGLTLWSNWDNDGEESHIYENRGASFWAEDLQYITHIEQNFSARTHVIEQTWNLPAGNYTFVVGGSSASSEFEGNQGYKATITTVPEPGTGVLVVLGGALIGLRRGRRAVTSNSAGH